MMDGCYNGWLIFILIFMIYYLVRCVVKLLGLEEGVGNSKRLVGIDRSLVLVSAVRT